MMFDCGLQNIFQLKSGQSRSINWENRNGEKGKGGMASSDLGPSRKGSPCIPKIEAGETVSSGKTNAHTEYINPNKNKSKYSQYFILIDFHVI